MTINKGGVPVNESHGTRYKTPGGIFLTNLKSDQYIDQGVKKDIFKETKKQTRNKKRSLQLSKNMESIFKLF